MTETEARMFIRGLTTDGSGFTSTQGVRWRDHCHVATDVFRQAVAAKLSREPIYDPAYGEGPYAGVALIELYLTDVLPGIEWFYGIFTVDDFGIWYTDQEGAIDAPILRQRVIPWRYVSGMVVHQRTG